MTGFLLRFCALIGAVYLVLATLGSLNFIDFWVCVANQGHCQSAMTHYDAQGNWTP